jgi:2-oxoglutarate ferredoxin oxidoreductase subunit alpha
MFDLTIEAFNLSETYRVPTMVLADEVVGHMWEKVVIPPAEKIRIVNRKKPNTSPEKYLPYMPDDDLVPPMACFGEGFSFHATGLTHDEHGYPKTSSSGVQQKLVKRLCEKIRKNADKIVKVREFMVDDAEVIVVAYGIVARAALSAVKEARKTGIKAGLLRPITIWPFPEKLIAKIAEQAKKIVVPEMNCGQLVREVERNVQGTSVVFLSKLGEDPHTPMEILEAIRRNC